MILVIKIPFLFEDDTKIVNTNVNIWKLISYGIQFPFWVFNDIENSQARTVTVFSTCSKIFSTDLQ